MSENPSAFISLKLYSLSGENYADCITHGIILDQYGSGEIYFDVFQTDLSFYKTEYKFELSVEYTIYNPDTNTTSSTSAVIGTFALISIEGNTPPFLSSGLGQTVFYTN